MIVRLRLNVSDEQRKAWRRMVGKSGMATRKEIEAWAIGRVNGGFSEHATHEEEYREAAAPARPKRAVARLDAAQAAPDEATCKHCGHKKERHGKMGYSCPAGFTTSFEAA